MGLIRKFLPFILIAAGSTLLIHGLRLIYEPAAWVLCGLVLIAAGTVRDWERDRQ